jgi:hypothetical protein
MEIYWYLWGVSVGAKAPDVAKNEEGDVLAHRTRYTYYKKYILKCPKNETKNSQWTSEQFMFTHKVLQ